MSNRHSSEKTIIIQNVTSGGSIGIACLIFGVISIFFMSPIFVPLALITGIIAVFKRQYVWAVIGLICAIVGFLTSPILMGALGYFISEQYKTETSIEQSEHQVK